MDKAAESKESGEAGLKVLIAGGGMAAVEALLAVRDLAQEPVDIELLAPGKELVYIPSAVLEPFEPGSMRRYPLDAILADHGATQHTEALVGVDPHGHRALTEGGEELPYDVLMVCVGARFMPAVPGALDFRPQHAAELTGLLGEIETGAVGSLAFVVPPGVAWSLPAYELALLTRRHARSHGAGTVELTVVTPEAEPLEVFGAEASETVRRLLDHSSIALVTGAQVERFEQGSLVFAGGERTGADRAVALPRLEGPAIPGLPSDEAGFIPVDGHCQVVGTEDVYAAGDATSFPIKQGGLATQQADAAAAAIAARTGAAPQPSEFDPVLRGKLLAEEETEYLRATIPGGQVESSAASREPLWTPTAKVAGRYLAPYLQRLERRG